MSFSFIGHKEEATASLEKGKVLVFVLKGKK
jgi:hypothetical protein